MKETTISGETIEPLSEATTSGLFSSSSLFSVFSRSPSTTSSFWKNPAQSITSKLNSAQETAEKMKYGFGLLAIGLVILMLSTLYLPLFIIKPHKFVSLFTLGSLTCLASIGMMIGVKELFWRLVEKKRLLYTLIYVCGIYLGCSFGGFGHRVSYGGAILGLAMQVFCNINLHLGIFTGLHSSGQCSWRKNCS